MIEQHDRAGSMGTVAGAARLAVALLAAAWAVSGCGHKGPLYLPAAEQAAEQAPEGALPATSAENPSQKPDDAAKDDGD